jgi:hypothetical protein
VAGMGDLFLRFRGAVFYGSTGDVHVAQTHIPGLCSILAGRPTWPSMNRRDSDL